MASCYDMKTGEVYSCEFCGFEIEVTKEGEDVGISSKKDGCYLDDGLSCMQCCGKPMAKKSA